MSRTNIEETVPVLHRALLVQNARWTAVVDARAPMLRVFGVLVSLVGIGLSLYLARRADDASWLAFAAVFAIVFVVFLNVRRLRDRIRPSSQRTACRMLARTAARMLRRNLSLAPYVVDYEIEGKVLAAKAPALRFDRRAELSSFRLAMFGPGVVLLFAKTRSLRPKRVLFFEGDEAQHALRSALEQAAVAIERVPDEPPPGYAP